jgi:YVTN family beta-propeller protein
VIDTSANKVVATVVVGSEPFGVAVTPDGKHVYVTNVGTNPGTVSVIATATNKVVATVVVGPSVFALNGVAVTPDNSRRRPREPE